MMFLISKIFFSAYNENAGLFSQFLKETIFAERKQDTVFKVTKFEWLRQW